MKRAFWITVIAIALLLLAAIGWVVRLVHRPSAAQEPPRRADTGSPLPSAFAR